MTELFKIAVIGFEVIAVIVMIIGGIVFAGRLIKQLFQVAERSNAFKSFRQGFGRTLLIALDLLVAADIILTVTLELTFEMLGMLGLLVLIRTFLHFVLDMEINGHWPWQGASLNGASHIKQKTD